MLFNLSLMITMTPVFSLDTLYELGENYEENWKDYMQRLKDAGKERPEPKHGK